MKDKISIDYCVPEPCFYFISVFLVLLLIICIGTIGAYTPLVFVPVSSFMYFICGCVWLLSLEGPSSTVREIDKITKGEAIVFLIKFTFWYITLPCYALYGLHWITTRPIYGVFQEIFDDE